MTEILDDGVTSEEWEEIQSRTETAYHEAGHAAACLRLGVLFDYVTIKPIVSSDSGGHCQIEPVDTRRRSDALKLAIVCHAGVAAASIPFYFDTKMQEVVTSGGRYDFEMAKAALAEAGLCGYVLDTYNGYAIDHAYGLFENDRTWRIVARLATALLEKEILSFDESLKIAMEVAAK